MVKQEGGGILPKMERKGQASRGGGARPPRAPPRPHSHAQTPRPLSLSLSLGLEQEEGPAHGHRCGLGHAGQARPGGCRAWRGQPGPQICPPASDVKGHLSLECHFRGRTCKHSWAPAFTLPHTPGPASTCVLCIWPGGAPWPAPPHVSTGRLSKGPASRGAPPGQPRLLGGAGGP